MTSLQTTWLLLLFMIHSLQSQFNQWNTSIDADGTYRWESVTDFIPIQSRSFGTIPLGEIMQIEFDFVWWGRTNDPSEQKFEMFFRVGFDAAISKGCAGQGARYPSFWLTGNVDTMHVSVSSGTQCQPSFSLNSYGVISKGVSYHISIAFNSSTVAVHVSGGGNLPWDESWPREPTPTEYIGAIVPVWWMSNKNENDEGPLLYNRGNGTFSNVVLTSFTPTPEPTTSDPTTYAPTAPSFTPTATPTTATPTTHTLIPTLTPTNTPTDDPSLHPTTTTPTTASPTDIPSVSPTPLSPTNTPTVHPSHTPTTNPSETPSDSPTTDPTHAPTTSTAPTLSPVSRAPTLTGETYPPTTQPTTLPTSTPSDNPTHDPTIEPTINPTRTPSIHPITKPMVPTGHPITSTPRTTQHIVNTIEVIDPIRGDDGPQRDTHDEYEYVEITIFATVMSLCFCTVISFLAYLTFKRKVHEMQKKRKSSPKYHMELNGADLDIPSKLQLNGDSKSKSSNHGENGKSNMNGMEERNYLQSPLSKSFRKAFSKSLRSPTEEHEANAIDSVYLSLDKYKSDSGPHSHLSISVMNMKDATPTPAVSPNDNNTRHIKSPNNDKEVALVMGGVDAHGNEVDITPVQTVRETVGPRPDIEPHDIDSEEDEKGYFEKKQANTRRKGNKQYDALKRLSNKAAHAMEIEEPYEQELDGYGVGLYTTPIVRNYGPYRKNTENTEGYESDNSDNTDFYNSYNEAKGKGKGKGKGQGGYEWIKKTLARVDSQNYEEYITNFERHKVADHRLGDLVAEDWKELIPVIGPRNEFRRLWGKYNSNIVFKTNGELVEQEDTTMGTVPEEEDMHSAVDLGNDLLAQLISNNDEALLMIASHEDDDVAKLTFDDIKKKFAGNSSKQENSENMVLSSVLSSIISNSQEDRDEHKQSLISTTTESMEISQSYEESQSKSNASEEENRFNYKMRHNPIPAAIAEDQEIEEIELQIEAPDRLKPGAHSFISPPISPPQYTSHKQYDSPIIARGKNPSMSSSSQSLLSDYSSMSQPPVPDDVDPVQLKEPLKEEESDSDDETLGIPKFHADVSDDSDSDSDETDSETESETKSESEQQKEFGQEVDVSIEDAIYEDEDQDEDDDEYETDEDSSNDDDDDESVSIDIAKSEDEDDEEEDDDV